MFYVSKQFMIDEGTSIAVGNPGLSPPSEVTSQRYHYKPCPLSDDEVPMPDHLFYHFFYHPSGHSRAGWIHRLPKKLHESIFNNTDEFPVGWGIHIIESLDWCVVLTLVLTGLIISGVIAIVWASVTKDVQSAFAIGGYFATAQAVWMGALYFKWNRD